MAMHITGRIRQGFLLLILACLLMACERGPAPEAVQRELQQRLDTNFKQDLFSVLDFQRTGSAPFQDLEKDISGIYVYYDADLELLQDYSLTRWVGLNLGTLAYAIGATESGIEGFRAQGNERGEVLKVHGRFAYTSNDAGGWKPLDGQSGARAQQQTESSPTVHGPSPESVLRDVRELLSSKQELKLDSEENLIIEELDTAIGSIDLRTARLEGKITLGSGQAPGTYYSFGHALSQYAVQRGVAMFSAASEGSVANASRLQAGRLDFGLVQSDVAQLLYDGVVSEGYFPYKELRAVASLWPEAVHLITLKSSGITRLGDLKGRRVAVGQRGSGSRINALLIGIAAQLKGDELPAIREIGLSRGLAQLESGEVDALFLTEAIPAPSIQALASRRDDLYFVSMPSELFVKLAERHLVYYSLTVPAKTYPGQSEPFTTLGVSAALMTHRQVADKTVEEMLDMLLTGGDELARKYYRAAFISRETMRLGMAVPLHPAAEAFYDRYDREQLQSPD
jgi:TRAP transporter TAXI family solute receptor